MQLLVSKLNRPRQQIPPLPKLHQLDLHLGRHGGLEVLKFIRTHSAHHTIPVIILSGDITPRIVRDAYDLGASSFLTKPVNFGEIQSLLRCLYDFWSLMRRSQPSTS